MRHRKYLSLLMTIILIGMTALSSLNLAFATMDPAAGGPTDNEEWSEWDIVDYPTCTTDGYEIRYSSYGNSETRAIPATGHSWSGWEVIAEPTCTESGSQTRFCFNCWEEEYGTIPALGHSFGAWTTTVTASCVIEGEQQHTCSRCGYTETVNIGYGSHSWGSWHEEQAATCTQPGLMVRHCTVCYQYDSYYTGYADHTYGEWTILANADDFHTGLRQRTCQVCGGIQEESFFPDGTLQYGDTGSAVENLQKALNAAGYDCGTADGIYGDLTYNAVAAFEAANGIEGDGIAWPGVQKLLNEGCALLLNFSMFDSTPREDNGQDVVYEILMTYMGWDTLENTEVHYEIGTWNGDKLELIQAGGVYTSMDPLTMEPGDTVPITFNYTLPHELIGKEIYLDCWAFGTVANGGPTVTGSFDSYTLLEPILPELPYNLPEMGENTAALLLEAEYDDTVEWQEGDTIPYTLTITNAGKLPLTIGLFNVTLDLGIDKDYPDFSENLLPALGTVQLQPGEQYVYHYDYVALDCHPGDLTSYLDFKVSAFSDQTHSWVSADSCLPDPLHHDKQVGDGMAALVLNGTAEYSSDLKVGDIVALNMSAVNVGTCNLSDVRFVGIVNNNSGMEFFFPPSAEEMQYLECGQTLEHTVEYVLTEKDIASQAITLEVWVDGSINLSKDLAEVYGYVAAHWFVKIPIKGDSLPDVFDLHLNYYYTGTMERLDTVQDGEDYLVTVEATPSKGLELADGSFALYAGPTDLLADDNTDFYASLPEGYWNEDDIYSFLYRIRVTPEDLAAGEIHRSLWVSAVVIDEETLEKKAVRSNQIDIDIPFEAEETESDVVPVLTVELLSEQKDYYEFGDEIELGYSLKNEGTEEAFFGGIFTYVNAIDELTFDEISLPEYLVEGDGTPVGPGEEITGSFHYTIPEREITGFKIEMEFDGNLISWDPEPEDHYSNPVLFKLPILADFDDSFIDSNDTDETDIEMPLPETDEIPVLSINKWVVSYPENFMYYTEGETVSFCIDVSNLLPESVDNVVIYDIPGIKADPIIVDELGFISAYDSLIYGPIKYDISKEDVERGYFVNIARVTWDSNGQTGSAYDYIVVDTDGQPDPIEIIDTDVENTAKPHPDDNMITDPDGTAEDPTIIEYDPGWNNLIEIDENDQETEPTEETEPSDGTDQDTDVTEVTLIPPVTETAFESETEMETQPEETQPEETLPPETIPPETLPPETMPPETIPPETMPPETIPPETLPPETKPTDPGTGFSPPEPPEKTTGPENPIKLIQNSIGVGLHTGDCCYYDLEARGDGTTVYTVHFCREHQLVQQAIDEIFATAKTPAEELAAWQLARSLWQAKLDQMYADLLKTAAAEPDEELRTQKEEIIRKEKEAFYLQLVTYEADLMLIFPEDPLIVAEKVNEALRLRTMDMCYELATASGERIDSYLKDDIDLMIGTMPAEDCSHSYASLPEKDLRLTEKYCEDTAVILNTSVEMAEEALQNPTLFLKMLENSNKLPVLEEGEEMPSALTLAWTLSRSQWMRRLDQMTTKRYLNAEEVNRDVIAADRSAFAAWLDAREALLTLLYETAPSCDEIVAEVMAEAVMDQTIRLCEALEAAEALTAQAAGN